MSYQQILFSKYLDPLILKEGKIKCPCCQRKMVAYGYNLSDKLVKLAFQVVDWCSIHKTVCFNPKEVFDNELVANTQFQKLKLFGIIERTKKAGWWKLTYKGYKFLQGDIELPRKVWSFDGKVILKDDLMTHISRIEPCWKKNSNDWILDYIIQPYKTMVKV